MSAISAAAALAATFNLACSGTMSSKSIVGDESKPYTSIYRVDLEKKVYCEERCESVRPIADVQPTRITFQRKEADGPSERSFLENVVDRTTGDHVITSTSSNPRIRGSTLIMEWVGKCERAPFTGFPTFETKF